MIPIGIATSEEMDSELTPDGKIPYVFLCVNEDGNPFPHPIIIVHPSRFQAFMESLEYRHLLHTMVPISKN